MRSLRALMAVSFVALMTSAALASWYDRRVALRAAESHVATMVGVMQGQALNVLQTQELLLDQIKLRTAGMSWSAVSRSAELAKFLRQTRLRMNQISSIWLADASGHVRASSGALYPSSVTFENRGGFRAHRAGDDSTLVGKPRLGAFTLSQRRSSPTGDFDGVIATEISVEYFESFFRALDEREAHRAVLVQADGTVLAADSADNEPRQFPQTSELMRSIAAGVQSSAWNPSPGGGAHYFRWQQLAPYPVYVAYATDQDVALRSWYGHVAFYTFLCGGVWAALCLIAYLASQRAAAQAALLQAQRMEAIGQLASGVAHDFNNLLTTVIGNLDRISSDGQATQRIQRLAGMALAAAMRGANLTMQLLAFARRQALNPSIVEIDRLFDEMLPLIKDALGETISVAGKFDPDLSSIRIDPGQLEAALLNLALNARDAMPRGGLLGIEARNAIVDTGEAERLEIPSGGYVVIEVADTGVGMPAEVADRAFEPFFTTKETGKGSGLGLSMVYGFARQSGGTATLDSRVGVGTTIKLYIPRSEQTASSEQLTSPAQPSAPQKSAILVVEDQDGVRQMMVDSLEEYGHDVKAAGTAEQAMEILARDARIRVLVTDIILPGGMSGVDLVRRARELTPDLKVLMISGNAGQETIDPPHNGCAFLSKPFRASDLTRVVDQLL
jgi:signal transduction histidine kinase